MGGKKSFEGTSEVPDLLYHSMLTITENDHIRGDPTSGIHVLGTHSTVPAAKTFAGRALKLLGYKEDDFSTFEVRPSHVTDDNDESWKYGDGTIVYAKTSAGQEFFVRIDTTPNDEKLVASVDGGIALPSGMDHLHYVVQTSVDYKRDQAVSAQVQGAYLKRADAFAAAKACLIGDAVSVEDFAQYDGRESWGPQADWPFGDDVVVHGVENTGENVYVSLKIPPHQCSTHSQKA